MVYVHPALGLITLVLMVWLATAGLRARHKAPYAGTSRRLHRRLGVGVALLFLASAAGGLASTVWLRDDLDPATTWHGGAAAIGVGLMAALYLLGRQVPRSLWARRIHPVVGLAALAIGAALFTWGVSLLP